MKRGKTYSEGMLSRFQFPRRRINISDRRRKKGKLTDPNPITVPKASKDSSSRRVEWFAIRCRTVGNDTTPSTAFHSISGCLAQSIQVVPVVESQSILCLSSASIQSPLLSIGAYPDLSGVQAGSLIDCTSRYCMTANSACQYR